MSYKHFIGDDLVSKERFIEKLDELLEDPIEEELSFGDHYWAKFPKGQYGVYKDDEFKHIDLTETKG